MDWFHLQAKIEAGGGDNSTALHYAAGYGKEAVAAKLLQSGASVSAVDNVDGSTPLHYAAWNGKSSIANLLLQANASSTAVDKGSYTPAQRAKHCGHGDVAARLLEAEQAAALK